MVSAGTGLGNCLLCFPRVARFTLWLKHCGMCLGSCYSELLEAPSRSVDLSICCPAADSRMPARLSSASAGASSQGCRSSQRPGPVSRGVCRPCPQSGWGLCQAVKRKRVVGTVGVPFALFITVFSIQNVSGVFLLCILKTLVFCNAGFQLLVHLK